MRLGGFRGIITTTFTDRMDVKRYEDIENEDGSTSTVLLEDVFLTGIPCRLSFYYEEQAHDDKLLETRVEMTPKIFYRIEDKLMAGDVVTVTRYDSFGNALGYYEGKLGKPLLFETHTQAQFLVEEFN